MTSQLDPSLNGPLLEIEKKIFAAAPDIERWFRQEWQEHTPPFYCSVDLRNAGFKLAPVDTNLFPGGFNNLAPETLPLAVHATTAAIEKYCPDAKNLLLIPERHTRNAFYLENIGRLIEIFRQIGLNVRLSSLSEDVKEPMSIELPNGTKLTVEPLERTGTGHRIGLNNFDPCVVLLNNDLSSGIPPILENLHEQTLLPPLHAGWVVRRKTNHFAAYDETVKKFAAIVDLDPWLFNPYFARCDEVNFQTRTGEDALAARIDTVLDKIRKKYNEYGIKERPFVIVKANAGTYGMGIMTVHDASEIKHLNRKQRNKMAVVKEGLQVSDVIIQEGVHTFERVNKAVAEPVVYMIDRYVIGGFYRIHEARGIDENLNSPGAHYVPLAFSPQDMPSDLRAGIGAPSQHRSYLYGIVARMALLAASMELEKEAPNPEEYCPGATMKLAFPPTPSALYNGHSDRAAQ
jgi:glutamate--cysteine ligase